MDSNRIIHPPLHTHPKLRQQLTPGEYKVFDFFYRNLSPKWEIYIQPHLNGIRPDFVLLNPNVGIGVFEVRDWDLRKTNYFTQENHWGHKGRCYKKKTGEISSVEHKKPVTRVNLYKEDIFNLYCPRLKEKFGWAVITAGVILPYCETAKAKIFLNLS